MLPFVGSKAGVQAADRSERRYQALASPVGRPIARLDDAVRPRSRQVARSGHEEAGDHGTAHECDDRDQGAQRASRRSCPASALILIVSTMSMRMPARISAMSSGWFMYPVPDRVGHLDRRRAAAQPGRRIFAVGVHEEI